MLKRLKGVVSSIASGSEAVHAGLGRKAAVLLLSLVMNRLRLRTIAAHLNRQRTSCMADPSHSECFRPRPTSCRLLNEYFERIFYLSTRTQYSKTVKSRTVSTGQKGSQRTYNCPKRYASAAWFGRTAFVESVSDTFSCFASEPRNSMMAS